jgi:hypothetical protein
MQSKVKVCANAQGQVVVPTRNPDYSYIRLEQTVVEYSEDGWRRPKTRSTLIMGLTSEMDSAGFTLGMELPGRIVIRESHQPSSDEKANRELKVAGDTGVVCRVDDQPIYRRTFYDPNNQHTDSFIQHNNKDEIRASQVILKNQVADLMR